MRRLAAAAATAAIIILPAPALAADFPVFPVKATAPVAAAYDWSGFYFGANAGYGWGPEDIENRLNVVSGAISSPYVAEAHGWLGGLQSGYNWMLTPRFLAGFEVDLSAANIRDPHTLPGSGPGNLVAVQNKIDRFGTARGRVGWTFGSLLVYGTAGLAWLHVDHTRIQVQGTDNNAVPGSLDSMSASRAGWTAGAGIELGLAHHWSLKTEYLYLTSFEPIAIMNSLAEASNTLGIRDSIVRTGVNYKF